MEVLPKILMLLEEKHIQQKDLSDFLGLSKNTITGWKSGNCTSYMKHLPKIAEFLNVSVEYLLGNDNNADNGVFTYALYNELTHGLSTEQMEQLKQFADFLRNSQ